MVQWQIYQNKAYKLKLSCKFARTEYFEAEVHLLVDT